MFFLGIDGGGTKTAFLLINENGDIIEAKTIATVSYKHVGMTGKRTFVSLFLTGESRKTVMVNFCPVLKK